MAIPDCRREEQIKTCNPSDLRDDSTDLDEPGDDDEWRTNEAPPPLGEGWKFIAPILEPAKKILFTHGEATYRERRDAHAPVSLTRGTATALHMCI